MLKTIATRSIVFIALIQMLMTPVLSNEKTSEKQEAFHFSEKQKKHRFFSHYFKKFDLEDQKQFPQKDSLLCIGSSSMLYWHTISRDLAPLKTTHRGFGGSNMGDVLEFKDFFLRYNANRILIYEGDNDLWGSTSPEKFINNCKEFVEYIHKHNPDTVIYFLAVKPSIRRKAKWEKCQKGNSMLKAYTKNNKKLFYIDVASPMLNKDGSIRDDLFIVDNLHMNSRGYEIWTNAVRKALELKQKEKFKFSSITRKDAVPIKDIKFSTPPDLKTIDFGVLFDDVVKEKLSWERIMVFCLYQRKEKTVKKFTMLTTLQKPSYLKSFDIHFIQGPGWGVYFPASLTLSVSSDRKKWEEIETISLPEHKNRAGFWAKFQIKNKKKRVSVIKVDMQIVNPKKKRQVFLAIDEMIITEKPTK
jgi:lysophospholipase L1-like esterase